MNATTPFSDKQESILNAAFAAFASYGYRRTSMDDIAREAGMSRSALYLHWRNKEDIFRSLAVRHFEEALRDMRAALALTGQTTEAALLAAFIAKDGKFMAAVLTTPHGEELMDAGFSVTCDLAATGEAQMVAALAEWLRAREIPDGIGTAEAVAESIFAALKGLKMGAKSLPSYRTGEAMLARLFARALA